MKTTKQKEQEALEMQRRILLGLKCHLGTAELDHQTERLVGSQRRLASVLGPLTHPLGTDTHIYFVMDKLY